MVNALMPSLVFRILLSSLFGLLLPSGARPSV